MILYTPLPLERVLEGWDRVAAGVEVEAGGARLLVEPCGPGLARVVRLLSTDPRDYLRPEFSPGAVLRLGPG
jgi:hypothetical protein